jgi:GNAT superfamily N-acetyltransferase
MKKYSIEELTNQPGQEIVEILAASYLNVPLHVAVFPEDEEIRRQGVQWLFHMAVSEMLKGTWLGAREGSNLVGVLHYARSPNCSPPPEAQVELSKIMKDNLGEAGDRMAEWFKIWGEIHTDNEHWHLGPFAVIPEYQGLGIGKLLMDEYCNRMDEAGAAGYLETEVPQNLPLYRKFGFRVIREAQVIGVKNWFMQRNAREAE